MSTSPVRCSHCTLGNPGHFQHYHSYTSDYLRYTHTHTHTRLMALFPGLPGWAGTRKVKPIWILLKQETVSGSGISWATCKSAPRSRQITMPAPHHSVFLQAGCPSCRPTNSVKALKAKDYLRYCRRKQIATVVLQMFTYCCLMLPIICIALVLHQGHATGRAHVLTHAGACISGLLRHGLNLQHRVVCVLCDWSVSNKTGSMY